MIPFLPPGTWLVASRYFKAKPGSVVVLNHDGRERVSRIEQIDNDKVYVLGDHSPASQDSRHFGWIPLESIRARVIWPLQRG